MGHSLIFRDSSYNVREVFFNTALVADNIFKNSFIPLHARHNEFQMEVELSRQFITLYNFRNFQDASFEQFVSFSVVLRERNMSHNDLDDLKFFQGDFCCVSLDYSRLLKPFDSLPARRKRNVNSLGSSSYRLPAVCLQGIQDEVIDSIEACHFEKYLIRAHERVVVRSCCGTLATDQNPQAIYASLGSCGDQATPARANRL